MGLPIDRRGLAFGLLAASTLPSRVPVNDRGTRLPSCARLWRSLPLPFTPSEAWQSLPAAVQAEIGGAVIGMALANYISGEDYAEADRFLDDTLRDDAHEAFQAILNAMDARLWGLFPELYGPDGDHPRWALEGGLAR